MIDILTGDCRDILPMLLDESVQCCVTSPPYWGLRDYGTAQWEGGEVGCDHLEANGYRQDGGRVQIDGFHGSSKTNLGEKPYRGSCPKCGARRIDSQLGLEADPSEYVAKMVAVFRKVWRVLKPDGTCWINLGDSYASNSVPHSYDGMQDLAQKYRGGSKSLGDVSRPPRNLGGLKPKDLCMMPARLAMALQADGWYLRSEIVWAKPNPMPESVTDRPTKAHEMIYLLAKQERYFYDAEAIREQLSEVSLQQIDYFRKNGARTDQSDKVFDISRNDAGGALNTKGRGSRGSAMSLAGRNKRSVWTIATQPYAEAHFATFPEEIPKLCILAGSRPGDTILDPFGGSGTVGKVALELGRKAVLIELNLVYNKLAEERTNVTPGFL